MDDYSDDDKEAAVFSLLTENNNVGDGGDEASDTVSIDSLEELENYNQNLRERQHDNDPKYVNCDFIHYWGFSRSC